MAATRITLHTVANAALPFNLRTAKLSFSTQLEDLVYCCAHAPRFWTAKLQLLMVIGQRQGLGSTPQGLARLISLLQRPAVRHHPV